MNNSMHAGHRPGSLLHPGSRRFFYPKWVLYVMLSLASCQSAAQAFQKLYTNPSGTFFNAQDLHPDTAQGYLVTGAIQGSRPQAFVLKTDQAGQLIWSKTLTTADTSFYLPTGNAVRTTSDNGLIISSLREKNTIVSGGVLIKTTEAGSSEWSKYAPCLWRNSKVCAGDGHVYYASEGKGVRKVYLGKISNQGQVLWERWLEAGAMDFYTVESLVRCSNGDVVLCLLVSKIENGAQIGPEQTVLFRIDSSGVVQQVAFFPVVHLAALSPLSDGRIAFRCSASDVTWTGMGIMDAQLNWLWFKKSRCGHTAFLPNIIGQELAVSGDESRATGIYYTSGGEKIALTFDTDGNLRQEEVYYSGSFAEQSAAAPAKGYARASGIRSDAFAITGSDTDGSAFDDCYFPVVCGLQLRDTLLLPAPIAWLSTATSCLQDEATTSADLVLTATDYCVDPDPTHAGFTISDSLICISGSTNFQRQAGIIPPVFGTSEWTFEGGIPARASGPVVNNVRFSQAGNYTVRHIFTVAGCRDTAMATIRVLPPPLLELGADTTLCPGDTLRLFAGAHASAMYSWSTGDSSSVVEILRPGAYAVTVTPAGGCTATDAVDVRFLTAADVSLGPDTVLCPDASIRLFAPTTAAGQSLLWSTGDVGATVEVSAPGLYSLQLSNAGCSFADTVLVLASDCSECQVYVPNVFSPESSRPGGVFRLFSGCPLLAGRWRIYDRWGALLFESTDLNSGWDGRLNGKTLPPAVYLYDAELQLAPMQRPVEWRRLRGSVTLVR